MLATPEQPIFHPSQRGEAVGPFLVMDVVRAALARAAQGLPVYHMEIGQPGTGAPRKAQEAVAAAMAQTSLGYTPSFGRDDLRAGLAQLYANRYGASVDPQNIAIVAGSSAGFNLAFIAAFEAGDRVALATPCYPAYRNILGAMGLEVVEIPVGPEDRFQPSVEHLEAVAPIEGLILASPSNPTGTMVTAETMEALASYCHAKGIRLISDEIYHGLSYGQREVTALTYSPSAIVVNSFSKYYSMTGWRVGWLVLPDDLRRTVDRLQANMFICAPHVAQVAALGALDATDELEALKHTYAKNRDLVLSMLQAAGVTTMAPPDGAFYIYADVGHLTQDSPAFCARLLDDTGLAITPGVDFDLQRGGRFVRFSFCGSAEEVERGCDAFLNWVRRR